MKEAMTMQLSELKNELARFGAENDAHETERARRMLNITPDTGEFLSVLVRFGNARRVLEIGTSNGYSTLWIAEAAAAIDGHVTTLEYAADKVAMARDTFARSGLADRITLVHGDAGQWLAQAADASIDLLFLDSDREQYAGWWPQLRRVLRRGGAPGGGPAGGGSRCLATGSDPGSALVGVDLGRHGGCGKFLPMKKPA